MARDAVARGDTPGGRESDQDSGASRDRDNNDNNDNNDDGRSSELGGVAFSGHGGIPFRPATTWGLPDGVGAFEGHVWVEAEVPLPYNLSVDGEVVAYLGDDGVQMGANGDLSVGFEAGDVISVSLPLGSASAGIKVRESGFGTYFSGTLAPDRSFLPPGIPVGAAGELRVAGSIDTEHLEDTRLVAEGDFDLGLKALGDLIGVDLSEALIVHGAAAQSAVDALQRDIDTNHYWINRRNSEIKWWYNWQAGRPWWEQPWAWFRYVGEAAWRGTEIAGRGVAIGTLEASRAVAWVTLEAAKGVLRGLEELSKVFPIDADPRVAALFVARDTAHIALEIAEQFLANFPRIEIEFFRADIFLSLGVQGFTADLSVAVAGIQLVRGWVVLSGDPEACVELVVIGRICVPF